MKTMDVYGYNNYPYRSDELAKQMFAQQALANPMSYNNQNPGYPGPHSMPAPSGSPWNMQGMSWGMMSPPQLMQFTAQPPHSSALVHCKRKSLDVEPVVPAKQLITEEKMAAHLNGLHISSDYTNYSLSSDELMDVAQDSMSISEKLKGHKLVLSEELKKLQKEPLLPPALIERLEKPCMSLVVWKPKEEILEGKLKADKDESKPEDETEEPKRRNGVLVTELTSDVLNDMDVEM